MRENMTNLPTKFDIDHGARFYPIIATKKAQSMFRIGAVLTEVVDREVLERAVNDVIERFPSYKVRMKKGYAWHYFERNSEHISIYDVPPIMLLPSNLDDANGYLFKVCTDGKTIVIELCHVLMDGNGAISFLKAIIYRYRELQGVELGKVEGVIDVHEEPTLEEMQDSFIPNYEPMGMDLKTLAGSVPHKIEGTLQDGSFIFNLASMSSLDVVRNAKAIGVSFTAYTIGMLAKVIEQTSKPTKPIAIMVPIDLRHIYGGNTHRNFVTFMRVTITPNTCHTLEEYVKEAQAQIKEKSQKKYTDTFISTTVKAQKNPLLNIVPLQVKRFFVKIGRVFMKSRQTIICSNLAVHNLPIEMGVERFLFILNVSKNNSQNIGIITTNGVSTISITRCIKEQTLFDSYVSAFKEQNIDIHTFDI